MQRHTFFKKPAFLTSVINRLFQNLCQAVIVATLQGKTSTMKAKSNLLQLNLAAFNNFVKLNAIEKVIELKTKGVLVDVDLEKETAINLYFINGFFVEEIFSTEENKTLDVIPYPHGYKPEAFVEVVETVVPKRRVSMVA